MENVDLVAAIETAFPGSITSFADSFIEANPNVMEIDVCANPHQTVAAYMRWCARNASRPAELVHDYTINALAEFRRSRASSITHLNFKHSCTAEQKNVVTMFLTWYLDPCLLVDTEQVKRSIKRWSSG